MIFFEGMSGEYGFLSNDEQVSFTVGKMGFSSMTQYLSYCKARMFGDKQTAVDILYKWEPYIIRQLGKKAEGFQEDAWNGRLMILLYRGLKAKFDQNPELISKLVRTGNEILVYCDVTDHELAIGLSMTDPDRLETDKWKGQNLLGIALMDLRENYQQQMPEGLRLKLQERLSKDSLPGLIAALNGEDWKGWDEDRENICRYLPYDGEDPYIYLNYSLRDIRIAYRTAEALTKLGFHVWYDKFLTDGRLWSGERSDAIEKCFLMIDIENGEKNISHIRYFGREFAEICDIPVIEIDMQYREKKGEEEEPEPKEEELDPAYLTANVEDESFAEKCAAVLAKNGLLPGMKYPEGKERRNPRFDLAIYYYRDFGVDFGYFKRTAWYECNLRTREVFCSDRNRKMKDIGPLTRFGRYIAKKEVPEYLSDEEVYRASVWKRKDIGRVRKSAEPEYVGQPKDWAFSAQLAQLKGALVPKIEEEYRKAQEKVDKALRDYPYMDEFEYMDSKYRD